MMLLKTVWGYQCRQMLRRPAVLLGLSAFFVMSLLGIRQGGKVVARQLQAMDSLHQSYEADRKALLAGFADTLTTKGKKAAAAAGMPEMINYRLPQNALHYPRGLACLAIGMRDIAPYYDRVKTSVSFLNPVNGTIYNPLLLFTGNLDLSFVLIYLLPLLCIGLCYDLLSSEREQGTLSLLVVQGLSAGKLALYKLLFYLAILWLLLLLVHVPAFLLAGKMGPVSLTEALLWAGIISGWLCLWLAVCFAVIRLGWPSAANALLLAGIWVCLLWVLPAAINSAVKAKYPAPLRADLASFERHQSEEIWEMPPAALVDSFHLYNPQYLSSYKPERDTLRLSRRSVAGYYALLEKRLSARKQELDQEINRRNRAIGRYSLLAPSMYVQQLLNSLAGTDRAAQDAFENDVAAFQQQWKHFLYSYQLHEKQLGPQDFARFPVFRRQTGIPLGNISMKLGYIWGLTLLILLLRPANKIPINH